MGQKHGAETEVDVEVVNVLVVVFVSELKLFSSKLSLKLIEARPEKILEEYWMDRDCCAYVTPS